MTAWIERLYVIPVHHSSKKPAESDWQRRVELWPKAPARWPGVARWGAPQGPVNESWVLDVDVKSGGLDTLAALENRHGPLPVTRTASTQSGGRHVWFKWDPERPVASWVARLPGIDTRGAGGYVVIPPTSGYRWTSEAPLAHAPDWLYKELRVGPPVTREAVGDRPLGLLADRAGAVRDAKAADVAGPGEFGRRVWDLALRLVRGRGLEPDDATEVIEEHYARRCDPAIVREEHGGVRRACQRAAEHANAVPWGFTWYHGDPADVLLRSIRRYGPAGALDGTIPYRVGPDGEMMQIDYGDGLSAAIVDVTLATGATAPTGAEVTAARTWWRRSCRSSGEMPTPLVVDREPGPALARLRTAEGPTPAWDEFLTRLDAPDTFLAWVWMLTLPKATRQVLWVYGKGHDGKTQVSGVIHEALGRSSTSADDTFTNESERWLGQQVYGRRLVVIDDTKMRECLRRGIVHRVTGGSTLKCEAKGQDGFDFTPNAAVLCTSNVLPEIGDTAADRSRLLVVSVSPQSEQKADFRWRDRLAAEFPALLGRARKAYARLAVSPGEPQLKLEEAVERHLDEAAGADMRAWGVVLEGANLVLDPGLSIKGAELMAHVRLDLKGQRAFGEWLREQGCEKRKTDKGVVWTGIGRPQ